MRHWIARERYLVDYAAAALWRRKGKNIAVWLVYTALVFLVASLLLFTHALKREAALLLQGAPEMVVQRLTAGRHDLGRAADLEALRSIRGVQRVEGRLWGYHFDPATGANYTFMVPPRGAPEAGTVAIGEGIARTRGAAAGDTLSFRGAGNRLFSFRVAELIGPESAIATADLLLLAEADFRLFFAIPEGRFTDIAVSVANGGEVRTVAEKALRRLPDARVVLREEILRTYDALFDWREGVALLLFSGAGLAFAILAWDKAADLGADERREIGILKAIGWGTDDLLRMKLWEGLLISLSAFLLGVALAALHVFGLSAPLFAPVLKGWAVLYPDFRLTPALDGLQLTLLFAFTVFPFTAATLIPAWRAAVTDPDTVMR